MKIKNIFLLIIIGLQTLFLLPTICVAQDLGTGSTGLANEIWRKAGGDTNVNDKSLSQTIGRGIKIVLGFVGTIFFVLTVYAGFMWMTAQGNDEKAGEARAIIKTAALGMIVVLAAYSITTFALIFAGSATTPPSTSVGGR